MNTIYIGYIKVLKVNMDPVLEFGTVHNWAVTDILEE
jgi:hypothetical protein